MSNSCGNTTPASSCSFSVRALPSFPNQASNQDEPLLEPGEECVSALQASESNVASMLTLSAILQQALDVIDQSDLALMGDEELVESNPKQ